MLGMADDVLDLLDWKRRIHELYAAVRRHDDPRKAWELWRETRDDMFLRHPQSPLSLDARKGFQGLDYFDYDDSARVTATFEPSADEAGEVPGSTGGQFRTTRSGILRFSLYGQEQEFDLLWLGGYGGGALLVFRDATSGTDTYGGGRYLLDTVKGADLGNDGDRVILDFNFSYNPSCSYDPRWECPLAPPRNVLKTAIRAGERTLVPRTSDPKGAAPPGDKS